jgi:hypothetical protein
MCAICVGSILSGFLGAWTVVCAWNIFVDGDGKASVMVDLACGLTRLFVLTHAVSHWVPCLLTLVCINAFCRHSCYFALFCPTVVIRQSWAFCGLE